MNEVKLHQPKIKISGERMFVNGVEMFDVLKFDMSVEKGMAECVIHTRFEIEEVAILGVEKCISVPVE